VSKCPLARELVDILLKRRGLRRHLLVHQWLGEARLIKLIVAVFAVTDQVDDNVRLELGSPVGGESAGKHNRLDVICVDVQDRRVDKLGQIGCVRG